MKTLRLRFSLILALALAIVSKTTAQIIPSNLNLGEEISWKGKLTLKNIDEARASVWNTWKQANTRLETQPLPPIQDMNEVTAHSWNMIEEDPMPFYWGKKGEVGANGRALFINIHGSGPKEHEWSANLAWVRRYEDAPSAYFVPQIPSEQRYRWWFRPEQLAWEKLFRLAFLDESINPKKFYFVGISEGGYGSQRLGAFYADYLAGAGPMAGGEPLVNAPVLNYRKIAFTLETGEGDKWFGRNTNTLLAKEAFDELSMAFPGDFKHRIRLQEGREHGIDYTFVTPWLINFEREAQPKSFSWVNFPMHDRYRSGFYNLAVLEPMNINSDQVVDRAVLKVDIIDNSIYLSANTLNRDTHEIGEVTKGKLRFYLSPELVDLNKSIKLYVNGKLYHEGKVKMGVEHLVSSCETFGDPLRLFPAALDIQF